ncbi:MAG: hypothetical protein V3U11_14170 [Planctomycetota bacterium]
MPLIPSTTTVLAAIDVLGDENPEIAHTCHNHLLARGEPTRAY